MCFSLSLHYGTGSGSDRTQRPHVARLIQLSHPRLSITVRAREFIGVIHQLECGRYRSRFCNAVTS